MQERAHFNLCSGELSPKQSRRLDGGNPKSIPRLFYFVFFLLVYGGTTCIHANSNLILFGMEQVGYSLVYNINAFIRVAVHNEMKYISMNNGANESPGISCRILACIMRDLAGSL